MTIFTKLKHARRLITLPNFIIFTGLIAALIYVFSFLFPITDNAFVLNNVRPVAAQVSGFITSIQVKNGQYVKRGQTLFTVFSMPYQYKVDKIAAELGASRARLAALQKTHERDEKISETRHKIYIKRKQDDEKYRKGYAIRSVSLITLQNSEQETQAALDEWKAALKQLEIDNHVIKAQEEKIKAIEAELNIARINLELTKVTAENNGVVQNLFLTLGTPVNVNQPLFSFINTDDLFIQANFNETDLRNVRKGCKAYIFPRMYLGRKMFHGIVDSDFWSANRQLVDPRTQLQTVINENQWILLPQRLPVIIRVTDPDPRYPLRVGASAYVYIKPCQLA
ncbi:HlyD family secretion protein [Legionella londiniensis]|uniref:HlyD family secretion protein n=1 Tax=Legionella londiniensis TaxID=45068 RepID=UPI00399C4D23